MGNMKIFRFNNNPSQLNDCWQKSIASACQLPCFSDDIRYILSELNRERKYWLFGYTKNQFVNACRRFKQQLKFCTYRKIAEWSTESVLEIHTISEKDIYFFEDQVIFDKRKSTIINRYKELTIMVININMIRELKNRSKIDAELFLFSHYYLLSIDEWIFYNKMLPKN